MADPITLILDGSGAIVRVAVGEPSVVPVDPGETAILRDGAAASAWLGWIHAADGSWTDPNAPKPPSPADLVAYTRARRGAIIDTKLFDVIDAAGVARKLPIEIQTRTALTAARVQVGVKPGYTIKSWTYPTGEVKVLEGPDIITFGDAADDAFQHMFDQQALCFAGIANGSITTFAQVEQTLGA